MPIQSRLAGIPGAEITRIKSGTGRWLFRVWMRRRGEVGWTNMSDLLGTDWVAQVPTASIGTPDSPVRQFTVHFIRQSAGRSLAPGISLDPFNQVSGVFKPFVHPDTEVYVEAANLVKTAGDETAVWRRAHTGVVISDAWPGEDVIVTCNSLDWLVEDTDIEEEEERGAPDPGTPFDDEAQGLIDRWMDEPVTVYHPDGAGIGIGPYKPAVGKLGAQIRTLAGRQAWDARYMWDEASNSEQYTIYDPPRDKVAPDLILLPEHVREVSELGESSDALRNDFEYVFIDSTGRQVSRTYRTVYPAGSPSYRRRWMRIVDTEIVKTIAQADTILQHASNDISLPLAQKRVRLNYFPWLQIHDVLEFSPDDIRFDTSTIWAIVGGGHVVTAEDRYTEVELRGGGPVGQYHSWKKRAATEVPDDLEARSLYDFREGEPQPDGSLAPAWKRGRLVASVWGAAMTFPLPESDDHWVQLLGGTDSSNVEHQSKLAKLFNDYIIIPPAPQGYYSVAHVQPYDSLLRKGRHWNKIYIGTPPELRIQVLVFNENAGGTQSTFHLEMIDPRAVLAGVMNVYLTNAGVETGPFAATLVAPLTWEHTYALHPDHPVGIRWSAPRNDGYPDWAHGPLFGDTDKVPAKPDVRLVLGAGAARTAYVDSPDTDAASQLYRLVTAGVEGPDVAVAPRASDPRYGSFNVTASEAGQLVYHVYAKNAAGVISEDYFDLRVDAYIPLGDYGGPSLDVQAVAGLTNYTIYWGGDNVTLSINGGAYGAPGASPITVARPSIGAAPVDYTFRAERNGVPLTNLVSVVPIDADTVTPNLTVAQTPGNTNNTTQGFTASATNPRTSASLPVTVRLVGCSGTNNGVALPADTDQTVNGPIVVNRPAFGAGNGHAKFTAQISGGGREEIGVTIPAIQQGGTAVRLLTSETPTTGTLTLVPVDGVEITKIETATKVGTGAQSAWTELTTPPYTTNVALVEKHESLILYRVSKGSTVLQEGTQPFDMGQVSNVNIASVTQNGDGSGTASVVVNCDSDTFVGVGGVKYSVAGGALQNATVGANRAAIFNVPQGSAVQALEVWGYNLDLVQGPVARGEIPPGIPQVLSANAAYDGLDALITVRFNEHSWSGTGAGRYRIDGGTPVTFDVSSDRLGEFTVSRSTTADILVEIAGSTQAGAWGVWFPLPVERYDPPNPALLTTILSVDDTGSDDVYTLTVTGTSMSGFELDAEFFRAGASVNVETFALTNDDGQVFVWTDTGAGDGVSQVHYAVAQMYDSTGGVNYGAPVPSRKVPSII